MPADGPADVAADSPFIHPTAVVEDGVTIGPGTRVWHHAHLRAGAVLGSGCVLGKNVFVDTGVRIGSGAKVQNNASIYRGVTVGDDVFVGPGVAFANDLRPRAHRADWTLTETIVHDGASIGANATIVCGLELGRDCMVAAGAVVTRSVAPNQLVAGVPARHQGWVCRCGELVARAPDAQAPYLCAQCAQRAKRLL